MRHQFPSRNINGFFPSDVRRQSRLLRGRLWNLWIHLLAHRVFLNISPGIMNQFLAPIWWLGWRRRLFPARLSYGRTLSYCQWCNIRRIPLVMGAWIHKGYSPPIGCKFVILSYPLKDNEFSQHMVEQEQCEDFGFGEPKMRIEVDVEP